MKEVQVAPPALLRRPKRALLRRSYYIKLSKKILWSLVAVLLMLLAWLCWREGNEGVRLVFSGIQKNADGMPVMVNPRYQGVDTSNRPFSLTAKTATQVDANTVKLASPTADITLQHARWVSLQSDEGLLGIPGKLLDLSGHVAMYYEGGYEMRTNSAQIDLQNGTVKGDDPVEGQGPAGTLKANAFEIQGRGERVIFNGAVRLTIYPASSDKGKVEKKHPPTSKTRGKK